MPAPGADPSEQVVQAIGAVATIAFSILASFIILKLLDVTIGLRVSEDAEAAGLDISEHAETGYEL
jgi:Amt family ammonium transporter